MRTTSCLFLVLMLFACSDKKDVLILKSIEADNNHYHTCLSNISNLYIAGIKINNEKFSGPYQNHKNLCACIFHFNALCKTFNENKDAKPLLDSFAISIDSLCERIIICEPSFGLYKDYSSNYYKKEAALVHQSFDDIRIKKAFYLNYLYHLTDIYIANHQYPFPLHIYFTPRKDSTSFIW